jgi:hypothetical protein
MIFFSHTHQQTLLLASEHVRGDENRISSLLTRVIFELNNHPRVRKNNTLMVVAVEGCQGDPTYICPRVLDISGSMGIPLCVMREGSTNDSSQGFGVGKTRRSTIDMAAVMKGTIMINAIHIPADCLAVSSAFEVPQTDLQTQSNKLYNQMATFRLQPNGSLSGKVAGANDDLVIAFMMTLYWSQMFCRSNSPEYCMYKLRWASPDVWLLGQATHIPTQ